MQKSLTLGDATWRRGLSFVSGLGMAVFSLLTIQHFFAANFPSSIWAGAFCDISAFFNCNSSAYSPIAQIAGVPLGYFGLVVGVLVLLGALFPSAPFERTNRFIAIPNAIGVIALLFYSVFVLKSLCVLCSGYYVFAILSATLFLRYSGTPEEGRALVRFLKPSIKYVLTFAVATALGAYSMALFHDAKKQAQAGGVSQEIVKQYFSLPVVHSPSVISPYWTAKASERFEDAPIHVIEYSDFLCPDCRYLSTQLSKLKEEFKGKINISYQFFPLEAACNRVVEKDKHPGACELSYMAAYDPAKFQQLHDEIFANFDQAKSPEWRQEFAKRHGLDGALTHQQTRELVDKIIRTGAEFQPTSDKYAAGIRSTPTMIINGRMIIGTLPYEQLKAIFTALASGEGKNVSGQQNGKQTFIENWQDSKGGGCTVEANAPCTPY